MQKYDLLAIIPAVYTEEEIGPIAEKVVGLVVANGGEIVRSENLGKLKLAYPIKHQKHGYYWLVQFDAEPDTLTKLDKDLRLSDHVVRHLITERVVGSEKKEYKIEAYQSPISEEGIPRRPQTRTKGSPTEIAPKREMVRRAPEMSMEELDKKLDDILEGAEEKV